MKSKKNKLLNTLIIGILLFGISLFLWNCETEQIIENQSSVSENTTSVYEIEEVTSLNNLELQNIIFGTESSSRKENTTTVNNQTLSTPFGVVFLNQGYGVTDTNQQTSYTFPVLPSYNEKNAFYNLVIYPNSERNVVIEYEMTNEFAISFYANNGDIDDFKGTMRIYEAYSFLYGDSSTSNRNLTNANFSNPCQYGGQESPCIEIELDNSDSNSSDTDDGDIGDPSGNGDNDGNPIGDGDTIGDTDTGDTDTGDSIGTGGGNIKFYWVCAKFNLRHNTPSECCCQRSDGCDCGELAGIGRWVLDVSSSIENTDEGTTLSSRNTNTSCETDDTPHIIAPVPFKASGQTLNLTENQIQWLEENCGIKSKIYDFLNQNIVGLNYTNESILFANDVIEILSLETTVDNNALNFIFNAFTEDKIYNDLDTDFLNLVNQYIDLDVVANPDLALQLQLYFTTKCAVLRHNNSTWSDAKIYWEASKDFVHIALDGFGMIPVVGEIADLTNGVLYLIEDDGVNATLSFAATVPIVGWGATTGKYVFKLTATTLGTKVRLTWKVLENGIVYFGSSGSKLRKVLGITDAALQAHHLMPWALKNHDAIQKAAKSGSAFHMNEALNGIAVASWRNQPNHNLYNNRVEALLDAIPSNLSIDETYNKVTNILNTVRNAIINNPNTHLNDLIF